MNRRHFLLGVAATTVLAPLARSIPAAFAAAPPPILPPAGEVPRVFAGVDLAPDPQRLTAAVIRRAIRNLRRQAADYNRELGELYGVRLHEAMVRTLEERGAIDPERGIPIEGEPDRFGRYGYVSWRVNFIYGPSDPDLRMVSFLPDYRPPRLDPFPWQPAPSYGGREGSAGDIEKYRRPS